MLILTGSPRKNGNSIHIANSLEKVCEEKQLKCTRVNIYEYFESDLEPLNDSFNKCDVIALVSPLYVDGFPYPVIDFLYKLEENIKLRKALEGKGLFFIGQCNFPESRRIKPMSNSAEIFANKLKMKWYGSLAFGGAVMQIEGKSLEEAGKVGSQMIMGLSLAVDDILNNKMISIEAQKRFKKDINSILFRPIIFFVNNFMAKE